MSAVECEIGELEKVSFEPGFYEDMDKAGKILQKIKSLKTRFRVLMILKTSGRMFLPSWNWELKRMTTAYWVK